MELHGEKQERRRGWRIPLGHVPMHPPVNPKVTKWAEEEYDDNMPYLIKVITRTSDYT